MDIATLQFLGTVREIRKHSTLDVVTAKEDGLIVDRKRKAVM